MSVVYPLYQLITYTSLQNRLNTQSTHLCCQSVGAGICSRCDISRIVLIEDNTSRRNLGVIGTPIACRIGMRCKTPIHTGFAEYSSKSNT